MFALGPWTCRRYSEVGVSNQWLVNCRDGRVAVVNRASASAAEQNAKLIASAPDLYEALDQLLDDMGDDGLSVCQAAKDQAKAALARARGEKAE